MIRFPRLKARITDVVSTMVKGWLQPVQEKVKELIDYELAYINTKHPDFEAAALLDEFMQRRAQQNQSGLIGWFWLFDTACNFANFSGGHFSFLLIYFSTTHTIGSGWNSWAIGAD